jgi:hypothetical protein
VLVRNPPEIADTGEAGARNGRRTLGTMADAVESAAEAAMEVVADAARAMLPDKRQAKRSSEARVR